MKFIFCSDPLNSKIADPEYASEYQCVQRLGNEAHLVSLEALLEGNLSQAVRRIPHFDLPQPFIYRGWMLRPEHYAQLHDALLSKNAVLVNSPAEYKTCHYFPYSYEAIKPATPLSVWLDINQWGTDFENIMAMLDKFGNQPVLVKDYVKSRKHEWEEACYIPDASDKNKAGFVIRNFVVRQGVELNGGLVIREFIPLKQLISHPKSGMPLSLEYRLFFLDKKQIAAIPYWDEAEYQDDGLDLSTFVELAQGIGSRFFTMDIAKTSGGDWIIIEVGDGQVSGLPYHADTEKFYREISSAQG